MSSNLLVLVLFGLLFLTMLFRVAGPFGQKPKGQLIQKFGLSYRERLNYHRVSLYLLGLVMLLGGLGGWLPFVWQVMVVLVAFAVVSLPASYIITSEGLVFNRVVFRPWQDFRQIEQAGRNLELAAVKGLRPFKIRLSGSKAQAIEQLALKYISTTSKKKENYNRSARPASLKLKSWWFFILGLGLISLFAGLVLMLSPVARAENPTPTPLPVGDPSGLKTGTGVDVLNTAPNPGAPDIKPGDTAAQIAAKNADFYERTRKADPFAAGLADSIRQNQLGINFAWTLLTGYLVMFMQLGFAFIETGFCRFKNAFHVMGMNFCIYFIAMFGYWVCGFAFQFGGVAASGQGVPALGGLAVLNNELKFGDWGIIGGTGFFLNGDSYDVGVAVMFLFQMVFMDTAATIPTGALSERWRWLSFVLYGLFISTILYPIFGNWAWGGGWLSQLGDKEFGPGWGVGYADFAGSGVVHAIGGWTALAGAIVLGPRLGKYNRDGSSNPVPGHNMVLAIAGTLILAFGWFGFNSGSSLAASGGGALRIGLTAVVTMLAGMGGAMGVMLITWFLNGRPDIGMTCNGMLGGLVSITAPSGFVSPVNAVIIGAIGGVLVVTFVGLVDKVFRIDDPVGAISVHGVCGMWGQLAVGLFADGTAGYSSVRGVFYGDSSQFFAQLTGAAVAFGWAFGLSFIFFKVLEVLLAGNRPTEEQELAGLDAGELVQPGYLDTDPLEGKWPLPEEAVPGLLNRRF